MSVAPTSIEHMFEEESGQSPGALAPALADLDSSSMSDAALIDAIVDAERLASFAAARDVTCRFPGCRRPAVGCDLDHTRRYPDGPTCPCDLAALCRHHHRLKHETGWTVSQDAHGVLTWTSPTGHVYRTHPPPRGHPEQPPQSEQPSKHEEPPRPGADQPTTAKPTNASHETAA
jgi:hypothetical protein